MSQIASACLARYLTHETFEYVILTEKTLSCSTRMSQIASACLARYLTHETCEYVILTEDLVMLDKDDSQIANVVLLDILHMKHCAVHCSHFCCGIQLFSSLMSTFRD